MTQALRGLAGCVPYSLPYEESMFMRGMAHLGFAISRHVKPYADINRSYWDVMESKVGREAAVSEAMVFFFGWHELVKEGLHMIGQVRSDGSRGELNDVAEYMTSPPSAVMTTMDYLSRRSILSARNLIPLSGRTLEQLTANGRFSENGNA